MDYTFLTGTLLFQGISASEAPALLDYLGAYTRQYERGEVIYLAGEPVSCLGLVLSGSVNIEHCDIWGKRSLLGHVESGQVFAETYACIPGEPLMVDAVACERCQVLFLAVARLFAGQGGDWQPRLVQNLLQISAQKNLGLSRRILHTSSKTIRGRLLSYLSHQARRNGSSRFSIPLNRQQLADYLGVERCAMCHELSKMQQDGLLECRRSDFVLHTEEEL